MQIWNANLSNMVEQIISNVKGSLQGCSVKYYVQYISVLPKKFEGNCHQGTFLEGDHNDRIVNEVNHVNLINTNLRQ